MTTGMSVPPNWTKDDPDWSEDVGRKYDPHAVVEYEHVDLPLRLVLAPGRVPDHVAADNRGYRVEARYGEGTADLLTVDVAVTPELGAAHGVAADVMRLFDELYSAHADVDSVLDDVVTVKAEDWRDEYDAQPAAAAAAPV